MGENKEFLIDNIVKAVKDKETRIRSVLSIFLGLICAMIPVSLMLYGSMASKGCSSDFGVLNLIGVGGFGILLLVTFWYLLGFIIYGSSFIPELIKEKLDERKQPWYKEEAAAWKAAKLKRKLEHSEPFLFKVENWLKKYIVIILVSMGTIILFISISYLLAYAFWSIYC